MSIYFLCNKIAKTIISLGPLPDAWENISGLNESMGSALSDLSWAGHLEKGFYTEEEAIELGINPLDIEACKRGREAMLWDEVRGYRNQLICQIRWRVERHNDEVALDITPTEDIIPVLQYIQALRDITKQPDPMNLEWPEAPL